MDKIIQDFGKKIFLTKNYNASQKLLNRFKEDLKFKIIEIIKMSSSAKDAIEKISNL